MSDLLSLTAMPDVGLPAVLDRILDLAVDITGADLGGVLAILEGGDLGSLSRLRSNGGSPRLSSERLAARWKEDEEGSPWSRSGDRSAVAERLGERCGEGIFHGSRSLIRVSFRLSDGAPGRLQVESSVPRAFDEGKRRGLAELGRCAGIVVERLLLARHAAAAGFRIQFVGGTPPFLDLEEQLKRIASDPRSPVLITGERGSGKELAAYAIHFFSERRNRPFVPVNSAAFSQGLVQDELFGHERGSFTGAQMRREGIFEAADGGTLFFDEIGDMSLHVQATLLRVLDHGKIRKIGCDRPLDVDVRILWATNKNLEELAAAGKFRRDLYDRLSVFQIRVPSLRERKQDIDLLTDFFLRRACLGNGRHDRLRERVCGECLSRAGAVCTRPGCYEVLRAYDYPGNVRELRNLVYRLATVVGEEEIQPQHIVCHLGGEQQCRSASGDPLRLEAVIRNHIEHVLTMTGNNKSQAARLLGLPLTTLINKMKRLRMS